MTNIIDLNQNRAKHYEIMFVGEILLFPEYSVRFHFQKTEVYSSVPFQPDFIEMKQDEAFKNTCCWRSILVHCFCFEPRTLHAFISMQCLIYQEEPVD